jgi:ectoine hydroxylase-related dioxygenase (phytanoyl-CoA dioxygenase family)
MAGTLVGQQEIETFNTDGVVALRQVVSTKWLAILEAAIEDDIANPGPYYHGYAPADGRGCFHGNLRTWEVHAGFRRFCFESPMASIAAAIMASEQVNLLYDQLFVKEPGTTNATRWHNDVPYWPMTGNQVLSIWVALDPTTAESGALKFVRGSHKWGRLFQPEVFGNSATDDYERNADYEPIPDIEAGDYDIVSYDLDPGDAYVFHGLTVHGAGGNHSKSRRRRGYTVRYTGEDVTYSTRPGTNIHLRQPAKQDGEPLDCEQYPKVLG